MTTTKIWPPALLRHALMIIAMGPPSYENKSHQAADAALAAAHDKHSALLAVLREREKKACGCRTVRLCSETHRRPRAAAAKKKRMGSSDRGKGISGASP